MGRTLSMRELRNVACGKRCAWCASETAEHDDGTLCLLHQAEHDGLSPAEVERRDIEQAGEAWDAWDALGWTGTC